MSMYFVQWWREYKFDVGVDGYENAVVVAESDQEAKELVEKEHGCQVKLRDIWWIHHPLNIP